LDTNLELPPASAVTPADTESFPLSTPNGAVSDVSRAAGSSELVALLGGYTSVSLAEWRERFREELRLVAFGYRRFGW